MVAARYHSSAPGLSKRSRPEDDESTGIANAIMETSDLAASADGQTTGKSAKRSKIKKEYSGSEHEIRSGKVRISRNYMT